MFHQGNTRITRQEPAFGCIICGGRIPFLDGNLAYPKQTRWTTESKRKPEERDTRWDSEPFIAPAQDIEDADFEDAPGKWMWFYRAILDEPDTGNIFLSGITYGISKAPSPLRVPIDPAIAHLHSDSIKDGKADFQTANLFDIEAEESQPSQPGRIGYTLHAHCWLIVGRLFGFDLVQQNMRAFLDAIAWYWKDKDHAGDWDWEGTGFHGANERSCFDQGPIWGDRLDVMVELSEVWGMVDTKSLKEVFVREARWHMPGEDPFRMPRIEGLMAVVTDAETAQNRREAIARSKRLARSSVVAKVPMDIALLIVEGIYKDRLFSRGMVQDTRNLIEAFGWELPDTYWISRCEPDLIYEVGDLLVSGKKVDWLGFCLGLHELMVDPYYFCVSGLHLRRKILSIQGKVRRRFMETLGHGQNDN